MDSERWNLQDLENRTLTPEETTVFLTKFLTKSDTIDEAKKALDEMGARSTTIFEDNFTALETLFKKGTGNRGKTALDMLSAVTELYDFGAGSKAERERLVSEVEQANKLTNRTDGVINEFRQTQNAASEAYDRAHSERRVVSNHFGGSFEREKVRARTLLSRIAK